MLLRDTPPLADLIADCLQSFGERVNDYVGEADRKLPVHSVQHEAHLLQAATPESGPACCRKNDCVAPNGFCAVAALTAAELDAWKRGEEAPARPCVVCEEWLLFRCALLAGIQENAWPPGLFIGRYAKGDASDSVVTCTFSRGRITRFWRGCFSRARGVPVDPALKHHPDILIRDKAV